MTQRHFRVVQLDSKKVEFGGVSITSKASPGSAARKLLTSIAHEKGLKKNKKASMPKVKFCIQEYTQGSSKKVYGPYIGHFHKYTAAELKKAKTAKGKVKFTMKPVVKLAKGKNNMKGGEYLWTSENVKKALDRTVDSIPTSINNKIYGILLTDKGKFHMLNINAYKEHGNFENVNLDSIFQRARFSDDNSLLSSLNLSGDNTLVSLKNKEGKWVNFTYNTSDLRAYGYQMKNFGPLIIRDVNIIGQKEKKEKGVMYVCQTDFSKVSEENKITKLQFHGISNDHKTTWEEVSTTGGKRSLKTKSKK